jgi:hypothetical protein
MTREEWWALVRGESLRYRKLERALVVLLVASCGLNAIGWALRGRAPVAEIVITVVTLLVAAWVWRLNRDAHLEAPPKWWPGKH